MPSQVIIDGAASVTSGGRVRRAATQGRAGSCFTFGSHLSRAEWLSLSEVTVTRNCTFGRELGAVVSN